MACRGRFSSWGFGSIVLKRPSEREGSMEASERQAVKPVKAAADAYRGSISMAMSSATMINSLSSMQDSQASIASVA